MNVLRGSLYIGVLGVFVLAAGCQNEDANQTTDTLVNEDRCLEDCDHSTTEKSTITKDSDVPETTNVPEATQIESDDPPHKGGVTCLGQVDSYEPNNQQTRSIDAPIGVTNGLSICDGDEDWFRVTVPAKTIVRVGIEFDNAAGDLDLVVYDAAGQIVGGRYGSQYPSSWRGSETNSEFYGVYSKSGDAEYLVRVVGHQGAENTYSLHVDHYRYVDGESCTGAGFSFADCLGQGENGSGLLPFPFPDPNDPVFGAGYEFESLANYRFARRELIMLIRNALAATSRAFPNTTPLSLLDICQKDGITPGYDVNDPRHPETTHDQGGNIDIAYFQTDGANNGEIVCGDGAQHADGFCTEAAKTKNFVDFPRQAFFMAKLFASPRTRVVGTDRVLAPFIADAARDLAALPKGHPQRITADELEGFSTQMASGNGWPYHHHHIHLSMNWWSQNARVEQNTRSFAPTEHSMFMPR